MSPIAPEERAARSGTSAVSLLGRPDPALPAPAPAPEPAAVALPVREEESEPAPRGPLALVRSFGTAALKLGVITFVAYALMFNFSVVRGSSMAPGIHDGDRILVDHLSYVFQRVQRGDIVVLRYPLDPSVDYIKRVVGLPGDEVVIENGHVWVNGQLLDESNIVPDRSSRLVTRVQSGCYFVLGDNRPNSSDSREFGAVPREYLRGRVDLRIWPIDRVGALH